MRRVRMLAGIAMAVLAVGLQVGCEGSGTAAGDGTNGGGDGAGDVASACQRLISNQEIATITGIGDLAFDPTGSAVDLPNAQICPYQNAAGAEAIVTVYTGPAYRDGFTRTLQIAKDSPDPTLVNGVGQSAVWVDVASQLSVDLGGKGVQVTFLFKPGSQESIANPMDKAVAIAKLVSGRV